MLALLLHLSKPKAQSFSSSFAPQSTEDTHCGGKITKQPGIFFRRSDMQTETWTNGRPVVGRFEARDSPCETVGLVSVKWLEWLEWS